VLRHRAKELPADVAPEQSDPRTTSVAAGTRLDLLEALQSLAPDIGEAVALRDVLDLEYREIAALLNVPEGTVKSRIHDGRLRERMNA
jgi:RNA polymerase sigma-70 factor (ECF subfamily)